MAAPLRLSRKALKTKGPRAGTNQRARAVRSGLVKVTPLSPQPLFPPSPDGGGKFGHLLTFAARRKIAELRALQLLAEPVRKVRRPAHDRKDDLLDSLRLLYLLLD